jgi:hypothetical protein
MSENNTFEDEILDDVEIYDDEPDYDQAPANDEDGVQDDEAGIEVPREISGFMAKVAPSTNNWRETLEWYRENQTKAQIGFDPDGMCLKVCRTARNIPARYPSAKEAQDATPQEFRVYQVEDLRKTRIGYFDEERDSNRFGHIATMIGRVRGFDPKALHDTLWETNDVKSNELVVVRGDYFERYWGDKFKFGATWLNGVELDVPHYTSKVERFNNGGPVYNLNLLAKAGENRPKPKAVLQRIEDQIRRLPDNKNINNVSEFRDEWKKTRKIDMSLLDEAVENGRVGVVKRVRDEIRRLIATLPEE